MTPIEVVEDIKDKYAEWLEMSDDPYMFITQILAKEVSALRMHVNFLEKRLQHETHRVLRS